MKHRIRKNFSLIITLSMLLSMIPFGMSAESVDEFAGYETLEEIPFEFDLEPGDLPFEQLKDAVLAAEDIPACIDPALAEARGHVNRLYLQEPDNYTVMFQNRDGSKTVYIFSHPVKGMTMTTTASIQVNGSVISFSGTNAITSRIAELSDYNIGYSEVAYIPNGVLSADGIDLTEDARGWARGESMPSALSYNISSEAAAEYAASVTVPDADVSLAAVTPGITITPNDPAPLGGMTVMSISYSDLAGLMSFRNAATNKYLTMSPSPTYSLLTSANIIIPLSRWKVSYDSGYGYTVTNLYQPANNYLGFDDNNNVTVSSLNNAETAFTVEIVSTNDSKVVISYGNKAIDSSLSVYSNDPSAASFPTSCEWVIESKNDCELVERIVPQPTVRTENAGDIFYCEYTTLPTVPTYSDIELYFSSNDQPLPNDSDYDLADSKAYYISETGTYTVYYKDNCTGVRSDSFTLNIVEYVTGINVLSSVRIEQKGVGFTLDYEYEPDDATPVSVSLYYADTDTEVPHTGDTYTISTPGVYTVYYKDSVSGVSSEDFTLLITGMSSNIDEQHTHTIQPLNNSNLYLTMTANYHTVGNKKVYNEESNSISLTSMPTSGHEPLHTISRTFIIKPYSSGFNISATLPTYQYLNVPSNQDTVYSSGSVSYRFSKIDGSVYRQIENTYDIDYQTTYISEQYNTLYYSSGTSITTSAMETSGTNFRLCPVNIASSDDNVKYYIIICDISGTDIKALKYNSSTGSYSVEAYSSEFIDDFIWKITQVGVNAHLIKQTTSYWCGYTTILQALYGKGEVDSSWGSTVHQQIKLVANSYGTQYRAADNDEIDGDFNEKFPYGQSYQNSVDGSKPSKTAVRTNIQHSLDSGWCPFFLTRTPGVPYRFNDPEGAHFICIIGYDPASDCVIISNCHFVDSVFGIYVIPFDDFYDALAILYWH